MNHANSPTAIDWHAPWLTHLPSMTHQLSPQQQLHQQLNALPCDPLVTGLGKPLSFVPQSALADGTAYETHIALTGEIPTRDNLHDLFNACVWLRFPQTKAWLNAQQYHEIQAHGDKQRTRLRDAITLFDENGAIVVTSNPDISTSLTAFDWQHALVQPRDIWDDPKNLRPDAQAAVYLFGHALMEQLVTPRKPLCAHTWILHVTPEWFTQSINARMDALDAHLLSSLQTAITQDALTTRSYQPLPILGVPHFWADNADPTFYDDADVFRSGRRKK